jgi:hypothetical protein
VNYSHHKLARAITTEKEHGTMRRHLLILLAAPLLPGIGLAKDAECVYADETVDATTGQRNVTTEWYRLSSRMMQMAAPISTDGGVRGIVEGDTKYLGVQLRTQNLYPIPPELGVSIEKSNMITKTGIYDRRLIPFEVDIQKEALVVPAGSGLRITLEDRTMVFLTSDERVRADGSSTKPGNSDNKTNHFRVTARADIRYALDEESWDRLMGMPAVNMRVEAEDKYYSFGHPSTPNAANVWSDKYNGTIQGVLKCIQ